MRIIAGSAKGTKLGPVPPGTRPVSDRAREGVFSSLGEDVRGSRVLDLFAGTGAMGIEALSRGASRCEFVDRSREAVRGVRDNLKRAHLEAGATVVQSEAGRFLGRGEGRGALDLVYLDPPYSIDRADLETLLALLAKGWLATDRAWTVVLTRPQRSYTPVIPVNWLATKRLTYGDTLVVLLREAP